MPLSPASVVWAGNHGSPRLPERDLALSTSAPSFDDFEFGTAIRQGIEAAGFKEPREIQAQAIPPALAGRDVLGLARTGTGKTAAFALPILDMLVQERRPGPRALVIAPTRELAAQIQDEFRLLGQFTRTKAVTVFGGVSFGPQVEALARRPDVIVACPGRLLDHLKQKTVDLSKIEVLVLDEADRMFDMGFLPDIRRVLSALPKKRQNLLFSATMPREVRHLAEEILVDPVRIDRDHSAPPETIEHALYPIEEGRKIDLLEHLLKQDGFESAIVFTRTKHRAKKLGKKLATSGHKAVALQGNMSQPQREKAMRGFRDGQFEILVATDIAARGIDVAQVTHVINFDIPRTADDYTHRIGRTGRAERSGKAYTFVTGEDHEYVRTIEKGFGKSIMRCTVQGFEGAPMPMPPQERLGARAQQSAHRNAPRPQHASSHAAARDGRPAGDRPWRRGPSSRGRSR